VSESLIYCDLDILIWFRGRTEPEVAEWVQVLKSRYAGMKIAVGRDKLDEIQVMSN
jgi:trehalose 6-phosphate synthase complex regulatory subunit